MLLCVSVYETDLNALYSSAVVMRLFFCLQHDLSKRLSLPADLRLPESFVAKHAPKMNEPLSIRQRRASLVSRGIHVN